MRVMYAVILAGGGGTRLWPLSRRARPKPFLPLLGPETLFQRTIARLPPLIAESDTYVVTEARYRHLAESQAPGLGAAQVIVEPMGRNTAAAIALAGVLLERPADDIMVVLPADHRIADEAAFRRALESAARAAADGSLVTLGIAPSGPESGYGYIVAEMDDAGRSSDEPGLARRVSRFVEKPAREHAQDLITGGSAWWNAGIFVWRRDALLERLARHSADVLTPLRDGLAAGRSLDEIYPELPAISIDYALLEPASLEGAVKVVPADIGWSDVGSWPALRSELAVGQPREQRGVVTVGRVEDLDSEDVVVHSSGGRLVVTIGLRGTIVVDTPDVVLVCDADRAQDVRQIVDRLAQAKEIEHL
ncbi:mannose-1-phosphate guanylyltransferase [soil metagenome]